MHNGVVRTVVVTHTATDAELGVDTTLAGLRIELNGVAWTAHRTRTSHTASAEVGDGVVGMHAR